MVHVPAGTAEIIRSRQNTRLKDLRQRLLRPGASVDGRIAIEGEHLLLEALRSGLRVDTLFLREDRAHISSFRRADIPQTFLVATDAFDHASVTEAPQGIAAIVREPKWPLDKLLKIPEPRLVVLAGLQDPGNAGTILRTAEAFGATGVLLTPGTVHPWNQKVLRASAGSAFRLPVALLEQAALLQRLSEVNVPLYACAARSGNAVNETDLSGAWAFVIGNEGSGIPPEVRELCTGTMHVPCPGPVESLNAGVAASVVLYEAARQRRKASTKAHDEPLRSSSR